MIGVTSRGLFLLASTQRIVYVSFERYRSPSTINLDRSGDRLRVVEAGAAAQFSEARLIFPATAIAVVLSADLVWQCPPPILTARPRVEQLQTLRAITEGVLACGRSAGLAAVLPHLTNMPDGSLPPAEHAALLDRLLALRRAVQTGDYQRMIDSLTSLLGQGRGLTPSGDDMVIGLLLMLNRWHPDGDWARVNRVVIETAYRVTTTISANLIECAADGQGDERLITVVDGITAGSASPAECVKSVLDWGSSSGIDALTGMALGLPAF